MDFKVDRIVDMLYRFHSVPLYDTPGSLMDALTMRHLVSISRWQSQILHSLIFILGMTWTVSVRKARVVVNVDDDSEVVEEVKEGTEDVEPGSVVGIALLEFSLTGAALGAGA